MIDFENIPPLSKVTLVNWLKNLLKKANNYNSAVSYDRTLDLIRREKSAHSDNIIGEIANSVKNLLNRNKNSANKIIEKKHMQNYYKEAGVINFIKANKANFEAFISSVENQTKTVQTHSEVITHAEAVKPNTVVKPVETINSTLRESYMEKYAQLKAKGQKLKGEEWRQNESKMIHLVDEAASKNISLVPKREFKPGASEEERFKYFKKDVFPVMDACEASVLDGLEMFEKYGFKKLYDDCGQQKTLLDDLVQGTAIRDPLVFTNYKMTDKIADKYLDVFDKYAEKTFNDLGALEFFFNCCNKVMSEETALKFIATLKKFIYSQDSAVPPKVAFVDPYLGRFRDNPKIVAAMKDLMEYIKDLPKN